jgi:hypothetical protein
MEKRLTEDELAKVKMVRDDVLQAISAVGELEYQKILIDNQLQEIKKNILEVKKRETTLFSELNDKYGAVSINLDTGEFNQ